MFKLIFKTIFLVVILVIIIIFLAIWRGGEPFRWVGEKVEIVGRAIEKSGDKIDGIRKSREKVEERIIEIKERFGSKEDKEQEQPKDKNGTTNKNQ